MAFDGDPYRILGLARGASLDEVKRAYRRLAKANHPDAAGSGALTRFLAIQAAYEQLVEGPAGPNRKSQPGASANPSRRASAADPDRAAATRRAYGGRARAWRPADGSPGGARATGGGSAARGRSTGPAEGGAPDPEGGRRRGKATLGSTSYDDANTGAVEPDWSGASWYGTTSGTYWTINPKEYADPRKHGPEYQARARRAAGARTEAGGDTGGTTERPSGRTHEPASWWSSANDRPGPEAATSTGDADATTTRAGPRVRPLANDLPPLVDDQVPDPGRALAILARALTDPRAGGLRGRIIRAVVGWLPIAMGIGWLVGEITGCGRFAATCDPAVDPLILLAQGTSLVALLLAPSLASLASGAAIGLLVAAVAAALILSATGTAADEGSRRTTLGILLMVAWLGGLAIAIWQRMRTASSRARPVS
jgi:hypothetical protein